MDNNRRLRNILSGIKKRCYNKNAINYKYYGERGIVVCDEWKNDTESFIKWSILNGYREELSIDRIDVNGNYEPSNCRWVDNYKQANNKSDTLYIEYLGKTKSLAEWCKEFNISYEMARKRYHKGFDLDKVFNMEANYNYIKIEIDGIRKTLSEWEHETGISRKIIAQRYYAGDSPEDCLRTVGIARNQVLYKYNGRFVTIGELSNATGIKKNTIRSRRRLGWSDEEIITGKRRK